MPGTEEIEPLITTLEQDIYMIESAQSDYARRASELATEKEEAQEELSRKRRELEETLAELQPGVDEAERRVMRTDSDRNLARRNQRSELEVVKKGILRRGCVEGYTAADIAALCIIEENWFNDFRALHQELVSQMSALEDAVRAKQGELVAIRYSDSESTFLDIGQIGPHLEHQEGEQATYIADDTLFGLRCDDGGKVNARALVGTEFGISIKERKSQRLPFKVENNPGTRQFDFSHDYRAHTVACEGSFEGQVYIGNEVVKQLLKSYLDSSDSRFNRAARTAVKMIKGYMPTF